MTSRLQTRTLYYDAYSPEQAEHLLSHGFVDERTDESRRQLGVVLYEHPVDPNRYQVFGLFEVKITLPEEEFERAVITASGVPTGKYLFSAAVLNAHATWRAVSRDEVDTPEAHRTLEESEVIYRELVRQKDLELATRAHTLITTFQRAREQAGARLAALSDADLLLLLGAFLFDQGAGQYLCVRGERSDDDPPGKLSWQPHTWLQRAQHGRIVIVDLMAAWLVRATWSPASPPYYRAAPRTQQVADFRLRGEQTKARLATAYSVLLQLVDLPRQ